MIIPLPTQNAPFCYIHMNCGFADTKKLCRLPYCCIVADYVICHLNGTLLDICFHNQALPIKMSWLCICISLAGYEINKTDRNSCFLF